MYFELPTADPGDGAALEAVLCGCDDAPRGVLRGAAGVLGSPARRSGPRTFMRPSLWASWCGQRKTRQKRSA